MSLETTTDVIDINTNTTVAAPVAAPVAVTTEERAPLAVASEDETIKVDLSSIPARIRDIAILRGLGYTFREIAEPLDITPQAVSLMLSRHQRSLKSLKEAIELSDLSARAVNALGRFGVSTRKQAHEKNVLELLQNQRNCGRKTLDEIERWLKEPSQN